MKARVITIQDNTQNQEDYYDRVFRFMAILYENRQLLIESEKKVFLDRFIKATQGKKIILKLDPNIPLSQQFKLP